MNRIGRYMISDWQKPDNNYYRKFPYKIIYGNDREYEVNMLKNKKGYRLFFNYGILEYEYRTLFLGQPSVFDTATDQYIYLECDSHNFWLNTIDEIKLSFDFFIFKFEKLQVLL